MCWTLAAPDARGSACCGAYSTGRCSWLSHSRLTEKVTAACYNRLSEQRHSSQMRSCKPSTWLQVAPCHMGFYALLMALRVACCAIQA